jgi:holo-[acyl-carrier protein] synthase
MIVSVGIDVLEIDRVRGVVERHRERFLERCFHPDELAHVAGRPDMVPGLAARLAAKEAFQKCWRAPFGWRDVWVVKEGPRPILRMAPALEEACHNEGLVTHLSMTHGRDQAAAVVVLEQREALLPSVAEQSAQAHVAEPGPDFLE